jgi:hypothetical protein
VKKPQAVVGQRVAQHQKCDSPMVVVLVGQMLLVAGFVSGIYQAFVDINFLMRGAGIPCLHGPQGVGTLHRDQSLVLWAWQFFIFDIEVEELQQVGKTMLGKHFPKIWGGLRTENGPV